MQALKWIVVALAVFQGGWLIFDGSRALIVGDYVTAKSGARAGQLGPWSRVISAIGLEPRSSFVKGLHVFLGIAWLSAAILLIVKPALGWWVALGCGVATLWYLPLGTVISIVVLTFCLAKQN